MDTEYTVQASPKQVALYVDWYHVVAGKQDWGYMCSKIGASFAAYVQAKVASAMASTITDGAKWGIGGYIASGLTDDNWLTTARNVRLANGNADVYALGTGIALTSVLPAESATSQFRYGENSEIVKKGFLPAYKNVPLIELGNALVPNTINGTPEVVVPDDIIYMIPMGLHKPVKVVFEGNSVTVEKDPLYQPDHCYGFAITTYMGVDVVVGTKFGAIELA